MRSRFVLPTAAAAIAGSLGLFIARCAEPATRPSTAAATQPFDAAAALAARVREVAAETEFLSITDAMYASEHREGAAYATAFDRLMSRLPPVAPLRLSINKLVAFGRATIMTRPTTQEAEFFRLAADDRDDRYSGVPNRSPPDVSSPAFPISRGIIEPLLKDPDPKVRTWAIVLLGRLNRIDVLPAIAAMADDEAPAVPSYLRLSRFSGTLPDDENGEMIERRREARGEKGPARTVGDVAAIVVEFFLSQSPVLSPPVEKRERPTDAAGLVALAKRVVAENDPEVSPFAFRVAFARATGGRSLAREDRAADQRQLLDAIFQLPDDQRFSVLRGLGTPDRWTIEADVERALARFAGDVPREKRTAPYFLAHAERYFLPADADRFLAEAAAERAKSRGPDDPNGATRSLLPIAAARLRPDRAEEILTAALAEFDGKYEVDDRAVLAVELVALVGLPAYERAVETFYNESQPMARGVGRERFLRDLLSRSPERFAAIAARIVRDDRLFTLGPPSTRLLIEFVQARLGRRLVSDEEARLSYRGDEEQQDFKFEPLPRWHKLLRNTVDEWAGPPPAKDVAR